MSEEERKRDEWDVDDYYARKQEKGEDCLELLMKGAMLVMTLYILLMMFASIHAIAEGRLRELRTPLSAMQGSTR